MFYLIDAKGNDDSGIKLTDSVVSDNKPTDGVVTGILARVSISGSTFTNNLAISVANCVNLLGSILSISTTTMQ